MTAKDSIIELLREFLPADRRDIDVLPQTSLRDIGIDSLALVLTVTKFLDRHGIDASAVDGDIGQLRTVGHLLEAGEQLIKMHG